MNPSTSTICRMSAKDTGSLKTGNNSSDEETLESWTAALRSLDSKLPLEMEHFQLIRELGRGGVGVVFEARDQGLERSVALKFLHFPHLIEPKSVARFQREAVVMAKLHHTHIVPILSSGFAYGRPYLVMPLIAGENLTRALPPKSKGDLRQVQKIGLAVAEALAHAHQRGVLHRDIKPSNIMVDESQHPWLIDFGMAQLSEVSADATSGWGGTLQYAAPERLEGKCDARSDLYSLGATLYSLATGQPPLQAADQADLIRKIIHQQPTRPRTLNPLISTGLETVLLKLLNKQPEDRYGQATAVADDLRALLADLPISARRLSLAERAWRWVNHSRSRFAASVLALGALLLALLLATSFSHQRATEAVLNVAQQSRREAVAHHHKSRLWSTQLSWERGQRLAQSGDIDYGLLWTAQALAACPERCSDLELAIRRSLSSQAEQSHQLVMSYRHQGPVSAMLLLGDAPLLISGGEDGDLVLQPPPCAGETGTCRTDFGLDWPPRRRLQFPAAIECLAATADQRQIAIGLANGEVHIGNPDSGEIERVLKHSHPVSGLTFDGRGQWLSVVLQQAPGCSQIEVWNLVDNLRYPLTEVCSAPQVAWHPDRTELWYSNARQLDCWTPATGCQRNLTQLADQISALEFLDSGEPSATDTLLIAGWDGRVVLHETTGARLGKRLQTMNHSESVLGCQWLEGCKTLVSSVADGRLAKWERANAQIAETFLLRSQPARLFVPRHNPGLLWVECSQECWLLDVATWSPLGSPIRSRGLIDTSAVSTGGVWAATGARDGLVQLWKTAPNHHWHDPGGIEGTTTIRATSSGQSLYVGGQQGELVALATCPDRPRPSRGRMGRRDIDGNSTRWQPAWRSSVRGRILDIAVHEGTGQLATAGYAHETFVRDGQTGEVLCGPLSHRDFIHAVAFSPDGSLLATAGNDRFAKIWDSRSGELVAPPLKHAGAVVDVAWNPRSNTVATASRDGTARLWKLGCEPLDSRVLPHPQEVTHVRFLDTNELLTTCRDGTVRIWNAGEKAQDLPASLCASWTQSGPITSVAYSAAGTKVAIGCQTGECAVYSLEDRIAEFAPRRLGSAISRLAFNGASQQLLVGCEDGTLRLLDAQTGKDCGWTRKLSRGVRQIVVGPQTSEIFALDSSGAVQRFQTSPAIDGTVAEVSRWVEGLTGQSLDPETGFLFLQP